MKRIYDGHPLREFLYSLPTEEQQRYARKCGTTVGYLRKHLSQKTRMDIALAARLVANSYGEVTFASLRPDVDWALVRSYIPSPHKRRRARVAS